MKLLRIFGAIAFVIEIVKCDTNAPYDYNSNGADWGRHFTDCGNGGH